MLLNLLLFELTCRFIEASNGHISTIYTKPSKYTQKSHMFPSGKRHETLDLQDCQEIASDLSQMSINTVLIESNKKTLLKWYLFLIRFAKLHPHLPVTRAVATMFLTWWQCPNIYRFWIRLYNLIYSVTRRIVPKSLGTAIHIPSFQNSNCETLETVDCTS